MGSCPKCGGGLLPLRRVWLRLEHFQCGQCDRVYVLDGGSFLPCLEPKQHLADAIAQAKVDKRGGRKAAETKRKRARG